MTTVTLQDVALREIEHGITLANKHSYRFGSDGMVETCLDWLDEKRVYDAHATKAELTAPNQPFA
ncbi:MAG: hypothetical protein OXH03_02200 [Bacteroidetes bacterium]|nr:hypothetical protein [Bacteroidota bacterium]MDE2672197.1 hypothetical protein [Bacteroidota bacterium]